MMRTPLAYAKQGRKRFVWAVACALALLALMVNEVIGESGYLARRQQRRQLQALSKEIEKLKQENRQLTERIRDLRRDPGTIEELAREQLHLGRPGEVIVTLPPALPPGESPPAR